jgi:hypothetical protein
MQERIEKEKLEIRKMEQQIIMRQGRISMLEELMKEAEEVEKEE